MSSWCSDYKIILFITFHKKISVIFYKLRYKNQNKRMTWQISMLDVSQKHTKMNIQTNMIVTDQNENRIARDFIAIFTRLKFFGHRYASSSLQSVFYYTSYQKKNRMTPFLINCIKWFISFSMVVDAFLYCNISISVHF